MDSDQQNYAKRLTLSGITGRGRVQRSSMSAGELPLPPYSVMEARDHTAYRESSGAEGKEGGGALKFMNYTASAGAFSNDPFSALGLVSELKLQSKSTRLLSESTDSSLQICEDQHIVSHRSGTLTTTIPARRFMLAKHTGQYDRIKESLAAAQQPRRTQQFVEGWFG
ncbi:hypothetical protein EYF80_013016 [Liparis tanakae]|uniref:Uncharacterized protein n=1 Tax=Liparis tanakae TaxID=230148 RepID=A0A4Z2IG50_9TELE|nr:hypothetical protein EYF80_013016 [Liparis tanakae]